MVKACHFLSVIVCCSVIMLTDQFHCFTAWSQTLLASECLCGCQEGSSVIRMASLDYAAWLYTQCGTFLMDVSQQWPSNKDQGLHASLEAIALKNGHSSIFHANLTLSDLVSVDRLGRTDGCKFRFSGFAKPMAVLINVSQISFQVSRHTLEKTVSIRSTREALIKTGR